MKPHLSENELLELIEGGLDAARVGAVRDALVRDPALLKRIEGMVADRELLRSLASESTPAPRNLVNLALESAEREALLGDPVAGRIGPSRLRPILAMAAMLALVGGVTFSIWWSVNFVRRPTSGLVAHEGLGEPATDALAENESAAPLIDDEESVVLADASEAQSTDDLSAENPLAKAELDDQMKQLLDEWTNDVDQAVHSDEFATLLEGRAPGAFAIEVTDEMLEMALQGRLVIHVAISESSAPAAPTEPLSLETENVWFASAVIPSPRNAAFRQSSDFAEPAPGATGAAAPTPQSNQSTIVPAAADTEIVELAVPQDPARENLRAALVELLTQLNERGLVRVHNPADAASKPQEPWAPQLIDWTSHDVLWWSRDPAEWPVPRSYARVLIEYRSAPADQPSAPPGNP